MFSKIIESTPLTSSQANAFFSNKITGNQWCGDISFLATLRALIAHRMNDGERIDLNFTSSEHRSGILEEGHSYHTIQGAVFGDSIFYEGEYIGRLQVHSFSHSGSDGAEASAAYMKYFEDHFLENNPGWYRIDKVTAFYQPAHFNVICFVRPDERKVLLLCDHLKYKTMHYLQCSILAFMPWYFNQDDGVTELEMELVQSLAPPKQGRATSDAYEECLQKIADLHNFKEEYIKSMLENYETQFERRAIEQERHNIDHWRMEMEDLNTRLSELLRCERESQVRLLGLEQKMAEGSHNHEIMDFFLNSNNISLQRVDDTRITFVVKDYLEYFDEEAAEKVVANEDSYVYYNCAGFTKEDIKSLMTALFIDKELRIKTCATYYIDGGELTGGALSGQHFDSEFNNYMPNPHIQEYRCDGNFQKAVGQYMQRCDCIGAISQYVVSCKSLNFLDTCVMESFMRLLSAGSYKCIELPDGSLVDTSGAIQWIKDKYETKESAESDSTEDKENIDE